MNSIWRENKGIVNNSHQVFPSYDSYLKTNLNFQQNSRIVFYHWGGESQSWSVTHIFWNQLDMEALWKDIDSQVLVKTFEKNLTHQKLETSASSLQGDLHLKVCSFLFPVLLSARRPDTTRGSTNNAPGSTSSCIKSIMKYVTFLKKQTGLLLTVMQETNILQKKKLYIQFSLLKKNRKLYHSG